MLPNTISGKILVRLRRSSLHPASQSVLHLGRRRSGKTARHELKRPGIHRLIVMQSLPGNTARGTTRQALSIWQDQAIRMHDLGFKTP